MYLNQSQHVINGLSFPTKMLLDYLLACRYLFVLFWLFTWSCLCLFCFQEFLDGVFDAEKTATRSDFSLEISRISKSNTPECEFESSPVKRRKLSSPRSPSTPPLKVTFFPPFFTVWHSFVYVFFQIYQWFSRLILICLFFLKQNFPALRTSEETARLVATAIQRNQGK